MFQVYFKSFYIVKSKHKNLLNEKDEIRKHKKNTASWQLNYLFNLIAHNFSTWM